ncbi:hypothetical protein NPIL_647721 [Nephila pilipes]|uniref:Uncharacterized protein n=1 Tax=Nephila pilipes TaxID=299642 RepID=A0A8X6PIV6_NEPPI|nr:hypothetical protein NPIL_647721 [Nephila pilipes]
MEPTKRTISEILFEDEDMPFDSDDEIITECSQDFLEASPFFENLPSQFGNRMEMDTVKKIKQFISIRAVSSMDALYASTETPCIR